MVLCSGHSPSGIETQNALKPRMGRACGGAGLQGGVLSPVRIAGSIELRDYMRAQRLHLRPRLVVGLLGLLLLLLALGAAGFRIYQWSAGEIDASEAGLLPSLLLFLAAFFLLFLPWRLRRSYRRHRMLHAPFEIAFDDRTMSATNEFGHSSVPWSTFVRFRESKHVFLLYPADGLFHVIPKRLLSGDEEVNALRALLTEKVGPAT